MEPLTARIKRAIARGVVRSLADREQLRLEYLAEKRAFHAGAVARLADEISQKGGNVIKRCDHAVCVIADLSPSGVLSLEDSEVVSRVDEEHTVSGTTVNQDGALINETVQTGQFWVDGHDGENGSTTDVTFAVFDADAYQLSHIALREGSGTANRVRGAFSCTPTSCTGPVTSFTGTEIDGGHGHLVASAVFGDLTDEQGTSALYTDAQEVARSAPAREAKAYLYHWSTASSTILSETFDHMLLRSPAVEMVVSSTKIFTNCTGTETSAQHVNELMFENGVAYFQSAGNDGGASTGTCTIVSPGAAIGAFTVGGYDDGSFSGSGCTGGTGTLVTSSDLCSARSEGAHPCSSRGGSGGRSIVDVLGLMGRTDNGWADPSVSSSDTDSNGVSDNDEVFANFVGTSHASPMVAGAAIDFLDWYRNNHDTFLDLNPGALYAWMILFGDRGGASGKRLSGFDNHWGAGRLRMRRFLDTGLDGPWAFGDGDVCVGDGDVISIVLNNGNAFSADSDSMKAVLWWYDSRHQAGSSVADIDLRIKSGTTTLRSSLSVDNKEMAYVSGIGGQSNITIEIEGFSVAASAQEGGCPIGHVLVNWAYIIGPPVELVGRREFVGRSDRPSRTGAEPVSSQRSEPRGATRWGTGSAGARAWRAWRERWLDAGEHQRTVGGLD